MKDTNKKAIAKLEDEVRDLKSLVFAVAMLTLGVLIISFFRFLG